MFFGVIKQSASPIIAFNALLSPVDPLSMTSSMMTGYGKAMVGVWRAHTALEESDEAEGSPEAPSRFRKLRSSSSLNSLRMTLKKRLPLRSVQTNSLPENPTWEPVQEPTKPGTMGKLARGARQSVGGVYQVWPVILHLCRPNIT